MSVKREFIVTLRGPLRNIPDNVNPSSLRLLTFDARFGYIAAVAPDCATNVTIDDFDPP